MRPTTKDLARAAGVSLATVDRVLNDRPGVRAGTIERVNQAIRELGFVRDISAANLARKRDYRFLFVLPDTEGRFMSGVVGRIDEANRAFALERVHADVRRLLDRRAVDLLGLAAAARALGQLGLRGRARQVAHHRPLSEGGGGALLGHVARVVLPS